MPKEELGADYIAARNKLFPETTPDVPVWQRALAYGLALPTQVASNIGQSVGNLAGLPTDPLFNDQLMAPTTGAEGLTDVLGRGLVPAATELALTGKVLPHELIPGSPALSTAARDALQFGFLGAQEDRTTGAEQAAEGAGIGLSSMLPRSIRFPVAAAMALGSKQYFDQPQEGQAAPPTIGNFMGHDFTPGDISALSLVGAAMIPGQSKFGRPLKDFFAGEPTPPPQNPFETGVFHGPNIQSESGWQGPIEPGPTVRMTGTVGLDGVVRAGGPPADPLLGFAGNTTPAQRAAMTGPVTPMFVSDLQFGQTHPQFPDPYELAQRTTGPGMGGTMIPEVLSPEEHAWAQANSTIGSEVPNQTLQQVLNRVPNSTEAIGLGGQPRIIPPEPSSPIQGTAAHGVSWQTLFSPEDASWLRDKLHVNPDLPEIQNKMVQLKIALSQASVRGDNRQAMVEFAKFFEEIGHKPDVGAFTDTEGARAWDAITAEAQRQRSGDAAQEALQKLGMAQAMSEAQIEAGRKGKIPDLPEYRRTEGGGVGTDFLMGMGGAAIRGGIGGTIGAVLPADDSQDQMIHSGSLAALAIGLPYGRDLIGMLQRMKGRNLEGTPKINSGEPRFQSTVTPEQGRRGTPVSSETLHSMQTPADRLSESTLEEQKAAAARGKLQKQPEYLRTQGGGVANPFSPKGGMPESQLVIPEVGMQKATKEGGFLFGDYSDAMGRAAIGGLLGGTIGAMTDDPNDHTGFAVGAMIGAAAGIMGPSVARSLVSSMADVKIKPPKSKSEGWAGFLRNADTKFEDAAKSVFNSSSTVTDRFIHSMDSAFSITMPEKIKQVLLQAKGIPSALLDQMDSAILNISLRFNPDKIVKDITNKYFDGEFGVGKAGQDAYLKAMEPHTTNNADTMAYAKFAVSGRTTVDALQRLIAEGLGDDKLKNIINSSIGKYLTRSYELFTKKSYIPSDENITKLATYLAGVESPTKFDATGKPLPLMGTTSISNIESGLRQYIREVKAKKGNYVASSPMGQAIEQGLLKERIVQLDPTTGKPHIDAMGNPIKAMRQEWRDFYGEITNPTERIYQTVFRLRPMAEASKFFHSIASTEVDGIPQVFASHPDLEAFKAKFLHSMQEPGITPSAKEAIQTKLNKLDSYQHVEAMSKFGELQGKQVSRHVWDTLKTYDSMTDITSGFLRSIVNAHTMIKLTRTALSPITMLRNILTAPMFLAMGRGSIQDVTKAWDILHDPSHSLRAEIMERGIGNVDQVKTEFHKEFDNLTGSKYNFGNLDLTTLGLGKYDLDLAEKVSRRGFRNILDFYRLPDNLVRVASYLSAKSRIAEELGKPLSHPEVIDRAVNFTNRYTMNYDALPPAIKYLRNVPGMNLFLSYTAELARIGKNITQDVIQGGDGINAHGRMYAMTLLSTLMVVPELLQTTSEDSLSPQDKADWEQAKKMMPDYARTRYRFGIERDQKTGMFHYYDFTPLIATDAYNQMGKAILNRDWRALYQVNPFASLDNTPALNIATGLVRGEDSHGQAFRKIGYGGGADALAFVAKEVTPSYPIFPWTSEGKNFWMAYSTNAEGGSGLTNVKTGVKLTPQDVWTPYFSGIRPQSLNVEALHNQFMAQAKQDVANEMSYANQLLKLDLPPQKRDQVVARTREAIARIQQRYAEQVGSL